VVEVGAGDGTLATHILEHLGAEVGSALRYLPVERSAGARAALALRGLEACDRIEDLGALDAGVVIANELLDNLPFHLVRIAEAGPLELVVDVEDGRFVLVERPAPAVLARLVPAGLGPGTQTVVNPGAHAFLDAAVGLLGRGYVWIVDYGTAARDAMQVHGYRDQQEVDDVLAEPGTVDITSGVDFAALAEHARGRGLRAWGPVTQREALLSLGFRDWDRGARARQVEALNARRGIDALHLYDARQRANMLLGEGGLGSFLVLCVGKDVPSVSPRSTRGAARNR